MGSSYYIGVLADSSILDLHNSLKGVLVFQQFAQK